jgi:hypothetical protein
VVGFTGVAILAKTLTSPLQQLAREVFINGVDPWRATLMAFGGYGRTRAMLHTPVCVVFRDRNSIEARVFRYSHPKSYPWGIQFTTCPCDPACNPLPGDLRWKGENSDKVHEQIKLWCVRCKKRCDEWVRKPSWINDCGTKYLQHFFWTNHPLTEEQRGFMSRVARSNRISTR